MRIALIGDLQYSNADENELGRKMSELRRLKPDFAVVMGDFGGNFCGEAGCFAETEKHLQILGCPWTAIFGNHDVEYCRDFGMDYEPMTAIREFFGREPYFSFVSDGVLIIGITIERQPLDGMRTENAVYVSDGQFAWVKKQLDKHKGVPTVLLTHAPMAGSGLRSNPPMHTSATDTYMDHTYNAFRWRQLVGDYPQIKLWCSAHYHMGHDYDRAIVKKLGVIHVSCGTMTSCSRDGSSVTRILDINSDGTLTVNTVDHNNEGQMYEDVTLDLKNGNSLNGKITEAFDGEIHLGHDKVFKVWKNAVGDRYYISAESGYLWEYSTLLGDTFGSITRSDGALSLSEDGNRLYVLTFDGRIFSVDQNSPDRLERMGGMTPPIHRTETEMHGSTLCEVPFETMDSREGLYVKFI